MFLISELVGKEAITLAAAARQGTVLNAYFDLKLSRVRYITLITCDEEERRWVEFKELSAFWGDAIVISSPEKILDAPPLSDNNLSPSPLNLPAFNQDGRAMGIIRDIGLEGDRVIAFITDKGKIEAGTLLSHSHEMLIFNDTGEPLRVKKTPVQRRPAAPKKPKSPPPATDVIITNIIPQANHATAQKSIQPVQKNVQKNPEENVQKIIQPVQKNVQKEESLQESYRDVKTPSKIPQGNTEVYRSPYDENSNNQIKYSFLLGKTMQENVYAQDGSLIVRKDEKISEDVIGKARQHGKLVSLALHSI